MKNKDVLETNAGNIFADLGLPNPEERLAKAKLAMQINILIKEKEMNQKEAAELLGTDQAKISALHKGKLAGFSLERLFRFLLILDQTVSIKIASKTKGKNTPSINVSLPKRKHSHITPQKSRPGIFARKK